MKENNNLRESLEQMPTQRLDEMLRAELKREPVSREFVRLILSILEERESDYPMESGAEVEAAWEKYQAHMDSRDDAIPKPTRKSSRLLKAASIVAVICVLFAAIPQKAEAETFFEMLARWTDCIFEFFSSGTGESVQLQYAFETDNPGLQEVYDILTELGVTDPVVPMWIPEGYELAECETYNTPTKTGVTARFSTDDRELVFAIDIFDSEVSHEYYKDETPVEKHEKNGIVHNIMRNTDRWVVIWTKDNLECSLAIDCQEDILHKIIESIYVMEDA